MGTVLLFPNFKLYQIQLSLGLKLQLLNYKEKNYNSSRTLKDEN